MYLSLTFDYELFFGENYDSYENVLFYPTYDLIDTLNKRGISATFFADVCSVPIAEKYDQIDYVEGFKKQIQIMSKFGQDVQLHIHPHWYYSKFNKGKWFFSDKGYRLHSFLKNERAQKIISDGIQLLNNIIKPVNPTYECIAYRSGGFSLQPHEKIIELLYDNGIRIDSSIAPNLSAKSKANYYNYKHPLKKLNWNISNTDKWWKDNKSGKYLFEIPIGTINKSPVSFAMKRLLCPQKVKLNLGPKKGSYIPIQLPSRSKIHTYFDYLTGYNAISLDAFSAEYLYYQVKRVYRRSKNKNQVIAIIGHPKLVNNIYLDNMNRFIDMIKRDERFEFISILDAYQMRGEK